MYYVICPECRAQVEIPPDAVGPDRTDLFNVVSCNEYESTFDDDDDQVMTDDRPSLQFI